MAKFIVSEDTEVVLDGKKFLLEKGDKIMIEHCGECEGGEDDWPEDVQEGGLRNRMGLDPKKPLEDQTSPEKVAEFFDKTDKDGRGKVMYAVNSNQDNDFWKKVGSLIKPEK